MCGRFTLHVFPEEIAAWFGLEQAPLLQPRYNIAPTQPVGIVRLSGAGGTREWALAHWGLIPSWAKDSSIGARLINARSETAGEKPSFRAALKRRRCLIPASGFYEWKQAARAKQPYLIRPRDGGLLAMAGLWERWMGADGSEIDSCTIMTTEPNELLAEIHNRMPVLLEPEDFDQWLGTGADATRPELEQLLHLMRPYPSDRLTVLAVSRFVNDPRHEGIGCLEAAGETSLGSS